MHKNTKNKHTIIYHTSLNLIRYLRMARSFARRMVFATRATISMSSTWRVYAYFTCPCKEYWKNYYTEHMNSVYIIQRGKIRRERECAQVTNHHLIGVKWAVSFSSERHKRGIAVPLLRWCFVKCAYSSNILLASQGGAHWYRVHASPLANHQHLQAAVASDPTRVQVLVFPGNNNEAPIIRGYSSSTPFCVSLMRTYFSVVASVLWKHYFYSAFVCASTSALCASFS